MFEVTVALKIFWGLNRTNQRITEGSAALQSRLLSCDKERESPRLKQSYDGKINRGGLASSKVSKKRILLLQNRENTA